MTNEPINEPKPFDVAIGSSRFFQKADWAAFGLTSGLSFVVYWFTLSPANDLRFSGIFATSAMYLGVSNPPAYPVWTIYSALFAHLLPISNIGWRIALATATATAVSGGLAALLASRLGALAAQNITYYKRLPDKDQRRIQIVSSCVAGLGFGLDGSVWCKAVVADQWNFNVTLFTLTSCLIMRWFFRPEQKKYLYLAALLQGLILADSEALFPTAYALPFWVALGDRKLGRDLLLVMSIFLCLILPLLEVPRSWGLSLLQHLDIGAAAVAGVVCLVLAVQTRGLGSEWKTVLIFAGLLIMGGSACLLLPIFSMCNPPVNWGYPRTVEGFFHVLSRGQYASLDGTPSLADVLLQWKIYGQITLKDFGVVYLLMALAPFAILRKMSAIVRKSLVALVVTAFSISEIMLLGLEPSQDKNSLEAVASFFTVSHWLLAVLSGCGLMLVAAFFGSPNKSVDKSSVVFSAADETPI